MARRSLPTVFRRLSSDEYVALPYRERDHVALASYLDAAEANAPRLELTSRAYAHDRRGTAAALRAIDDAAGGGFYAVPPEAALDDDAAAAAFDGRKDDVVIDVQTHLANPQRWRTPIGEAMDLFLQYTEPERWSGPVDPARLSAAQWATHLFGESETAVALLTSTPGRPQENILSNDEIDACRRLTERFAGTGRVLTHSIVHPNLGAAELERMIAWRDELRPSGWKAYTMWGPPEAEPDPVLGDTGYFLDDEAVGVPFLEQIRALGPTVLAVHKGISGPIPGAGLATGSPRDIGPAAARFPDITFLVYHSGYEPDPEGEEGAYTERDRDRGVNRFIATLEEAGIGAGANVYAELGSTWFMMMRKPREAAHVLGKLLRSVGPDRIVWGTDCIWYGSPQPLIDSFRAFTIPEDMQQQFGYPALTADIKAKILGTNAASVYGVDLEAARAAARDDRAWVADAASSLADRFA
jgi:predicted TIM-barrel fold metal-dependent hydrolase